MHLLLLSLHRLLLCIFLREAGDEGLERFQVFLVRHSELYGRFRLLLLLIGKITDHVVDFLDLVCKVKKKLCGEIDG